MTANALSNRGNDLAATVEAQSASAIATAQAGVNTANELAAGLAATAQYLATTVSQSPQSIQATVTALSADLGALSTELEALLTYFAELGSISYDNGVMTATVFISEAQANLLLDVLVEAAGYDPGAASLNTTAEGTIEVVLVDVSTQFSGTLVMTYRLGAANGAVTYELVSATLNGQAIPLAMLPYDLVSAVDLSVNAAAVQLMLSVPEVGYSIETLHVTDDGILLSVAVLVEQ
jgi:NAD(P)-dependent dehydrogenase (short-subunit alcohol dehydrogenase family)